jgi:hypothetical protein
VIITTPVQVLGAAGKIAQNKQNVGPAIVTDITHGGNVAELKDPATGTAFPRPVAMRHLHLFHDMADTPEAQAAASDPVFDPHNSQLLKNMGFDTTDAESTAAGQMRFRKTMDLAAARDAREEEKVRAAQLRFEREMEDARIAEEREHAARVARLAEEEQRAREEQRQQEEAEDARRAKEEKERSVLRPREVLEAQPLYGGGPRYKVKFTSDAGESKDKWVVRGDAGWEACRDLVQQYSKDHAADASSSREARAARRNAERGQELPSEDAPGQFLAGGMLPSGSDVDQSQE